ncbi:phenylalanine--tRNA ligase subunit beta [soil metagenome]
MKVLLSWLRDFAPFEGDPVELGEVMSDLGMAVESLEPLGEGLDGIVVAEVLALRPHPDADRIQLVDVDAGDGDATQICCGAFNMAVGDKVPLATLGTTMAGGMQIARRKLRGEWSNGMLCSPPELGLGGDPGGILVLPASVAVGTPLASALGISADVLYDLEINPNRPDAMSVAGVARDLAARLGLPFALTRPSVTGSAPPAGELVTVDIADPERCGRFVARVLQGVTVGESPAWLASRLTLLGMRPINSLVDISNYVMLELGQPNHPYDLARLGGGGFRVRRALAGEQLVTLDDVTRTFTDEDLLICDAEDAPVGIAGIMGGAACEISETTNDVVVELAWFAPMSVTRTAKRLGLRTEASARFEKGCDPEIIDLAAARFAELAMSAAPDVAIPRLAAGSVDERGHLPDRSPVRVRTSRVNAVLGVELTADRIGELLRPIGFDVAPVSSDDGAGDDLDVVVPSFRYDTATEIDVVEEIARHHGYRNIARTVPSGFRAGRLDLRQLRRRGLRRVLTGLGLSEAMPLPFLAPGQLERCGLAGDGIVVTNPLVAEESVLRTSLLPGLVGAVAANAAHRNHGVGLFEIGHVFREAPAEQALPDEREHLAAALGGGDATAAVEVWRVLSESLALRDARLVAAELAGLHPTRSARIELDGAIVGAVGEIDPDVLAAHDINERVGWMELDLDRMAEQPAVPRQLRPVSRYPSSDIDLAFEVDEAVPAADIASALQEDGSDLVVDVTLFDVYRGEQVAGGRRSLAFTLRLQAADHTLTDAEVADVRNRLIDEVQHRFPAVLRG